MAEELFTAYHSHLPQHVQDDYDDEEVVMLRSAEDLVNNGIGLAFEDFYAFAKNRVVFVTPDTAISASLDTPSHHPYTIDAVFTSMASERTLHISGTNAQGTSPSLSFLLRMITENSRNEIFLNDGKIENENVGVTFKCFPMTPRQQLGSLDLSPPTSNLGQKRKISALAQSSSSSIGIEFRFLALNQGHCKLLFQEHSNLFPRVKLSQCSVEEWITHDEIPTGTAKATTRPSQNLVLSCTQHEFRKFAKGQVLKSSFICELHLLLHFMLADVDVQHLKTIIETSQNLEKLTLEFLDIDGKTWQTVCESLRKNQTLQQIELAYTEKFADAYRRLTPEHRHSRTTDAIELLRANTRLTSFSWPKFQQDESLMPEIERLLMVENNKKTSSSFP
eukprot:CAMPEP_0116083476 /NCGR_PEP_ID=MMETSP0327-20121206/3294_1 /TAXON_ID=44447 /ORGANISM="Pseudo-nitzschia delicatissima, Strain B596" /LENGTH=390 /DNA_ID=CAMNT_0003574367 /DNA_START=42 /DNA_END=1214 /DNA_ORIENTATION=-